MKTRPFIPILLAAALAGAGGYYLGSKWTPPPPAAPAPAEKPAVAKPAPPPAGTGRYSARTNELLGSEPVTAENATPITYRILEEAYPGARMAAIIALIENMTPENARGVLQGFVDITVKTGRKHDAEWAQMLRRYGMLRGAEGLKDLMPEMFNVGIAVEGLAAHDPDAALAAIQQSGINDPKLTSAWLNGICVKDPEKALTLALSGKYDGADGTALLNQTVSCFGVEKAREVLQKALDDGGAAADSPVFKGLIGALGDTLFHKYWTIGTPGEMLPWLEQQKDEAYLPARFVARAAHDNLLKGDPAAALSFLETMNEGRQTMRGVERLYEAGIANPQVIGNMDEATCARLIKFLPDYPPSLIELADKVDKVNPARAEQLRAALPQ
jgi:hypothetical protein